MNLYEKSCEAFVKVDLEFVIIGGFAVNFWGYNRSTGDLDFFVNPASKNLDLLFLALDNLGFLIDDHARAAVNSGEIVQFSDSYHTVELLFKINLEKSFDEIYRNAVQSDFGNVKVPFINFDDLILEKIKSKRPKDLNDVYELKKIKNSD